jgi:hypothetical protein
MMKPQRGVHQQMTQTKTKKRRRRRRRKMLHHFALWD